MHPLGTTEEVQEISLCYERAEEIVESYTQPSPLPVSPCMRERELEAYICMQEDNRRRSRRKRWRIALLTACGTAALVFALWTGAAKLFPDYVSAPWVKVEKEPCTIAAYSGDRSARLILAKTGTDKLTPSEIYKKVNPAAVTVMGETKDGMSVGTGAIITKDGFIVTNAHVLEGCHACAVMLSDGYMYSAELVGCESSEDLAVLKIEDQNYEFPTVTCASSRDLSVGDTVYAIGNPLGLKLCGSFTGGVISGLDRQIRVDGVMLNLMQTDAALNSGNSGGPLINDYGQVVGINTAKMKSANNVEGLNLALPMSEAARKINDLIRYGEVKPAPLVGVTVSPLTEDTEDGHRGLVIVEEPIKDGGGDKAGLQWGDVLLSVDGVELLENDDLLNVRDLHQVGDVLTFEVCRDGEHFTVQLTLQSDRAEEAE